MFWLYLLGFPVLLFKFWIAFTIPFFRKPRPLPSYNNKPTLSILTLNCFMRSWGIVDEYETWDSKNERLEELMTHHFPHYDIVCLQEVFSTFALRTHYLISHSGFPYFAIPNDPPFFSRKLVDSGLVILSKQPITYHTNISFTHPGIYSDQFADKGFQHITIQNQVHIINTHVQSDYSANDTRATLIKCHQWKQIQDYISLHQLQHVILCGDLNGDAFDQVQHHYLHQIIKGTDILLLVSRPATNYTEEGIARSVDYIITYHMTCLHCQVNHVDMLSDHSGVEALFIIQNPA